MGKIGNEIRTEPKPLNLTTRVYSTPAELSQARAFLLQEVVYADLHHRLPFDIIAPGNVCVGICAGTKLVAVAEVQFKGELAVVRFIIGTKQDTVPFPYLVEQIRAAMPKRRPCKAIDFTKTIANPWQISNLVKDGMLKL